MPSEMIVTADDYFKFINQSGYYSSKLSTLLEENTILIMGYSLGDLNLKSILNKHRSRSGHAINRQHLFFLSRSVIPQHIKDYYDISYGLRVIDPMEINILLSMVDSKFEKIKDDVATSRDDLKKALRGETKYTDEFLKKKDSFSEILATVS